MKISIFSWSTNIIFLIHLNLSFHALQTEFRNYEVLQNLVEFIIERNMTDLFQRFGSRAVVLDGTDRAELLFEMLSNRLPLPTIILVKNNEVLNINRMNSPSIVFILIENEREIKEAIEHLQNSQIHHVNIPTVMVKVSEIVDENQFDVFPIMKSAWNSGLIRFLLIYCDVTMKAISYNPFKNLLVNVSNKTGIALFPKYLKNLQKYPWRVSLFEEWPLLRKKPGKKRGSNAWLGRDIFLLGEVARLMNASFTIVEPSPNTGYKGAVADILENKVDFCFVRRFPIDRIKGLRFINTGSLSNLNVIVDSPDHQEEPTAIYLVFQKEIWFILLISIFALITTMTLLIMKSTQHYGVQNSFLDIWRILLNVSLHNSVRRKYTSVIPLVAWIWSSVILSASFQSRLIDLMKYPTQKPGIQTLKDLEQSQLPVYSSLDYVKMQGEKGYLRNQMKLVQYKELLKKLNDSSSKSAVVMPFAVAGGASSLELLEYLHSRHKTILKESLVRSYAVYTFPYHSPFTNAIYLAILKQKEYGFMDKLTKAQEQTSLRRRAAKTTFSLNLKHVVSAFHFLCLGLVLSLVIITLEISL